MGDYAIVARRPGGSDVLDRKLISPAVPGRALESPATTGTTILIP